MNEDAIKSEARVFGELGEEFPPDTPEENADGIRSADGAEQAFRLAKAGKAAGARIALLDTEAALLYEMSPDSESEEGAP